MYKTISNQNFIFFLDIVRTRKHTFFEIESNLFLVNNSTEEERCILLFQPDKEEVTTNRC